MADVSHYEIKPTKRKRHYRSFLQEKAAEKFEEKRTYINGARVVLDMQRSGIYRTGKAITPDEEMEQTLRCIHLWRAVLLQAFVDATSSKYKKAENRGTRYEALNWLEAVGKSGEANGAHQSDRREVLEYADVHIKELLRGLERIKRNNYDLRDAVYDGKHGRMRDRAAALAVIEALEGEADGELEEELIYTL